MSKQAIINVTSMFDGQRGRVVGFNGGIGMVGKLEALGVHEGVDLIKKSTLMGCGPVIISVGNTEVAIGYGMASKVLVEVLGK